MSTQLLIRSRITGSRGVARLLRGHAASRRSFDVQLQGEHGLTVNDYGALLLLARAEGARMRRVDLAEGLQLTASGVTRLLVGLERNGLVEQATCATDRRVTYAALTEAGRRKLEEAACSHVAADRGAVRGALHARGAVDAHRAAVQAARGGCRGQLHALAVPIAGERRSRGPARPPRAVAAVKMVVHEAHRLHERVDRGRADEAPAAALQVLRQRLRLRRLGESRRASQVRRFGRVCGSGSKRQT